jgi:hypothetical protein
MLHITQLIILSKYIFSIRIDLKKTDRKWKILQAINAEQVVGPLFSVE